MERYIGKPLARNPLALASLYKDGLGRHWKNQTEAAKSLSRFGVKREHVNRAMRIASMPADVLLLFTETGLIDRTARELIRLERSVGRATLELRAQSISKKGRSWCELVELLEGKSPTPRKPAPQVALPFVRASLYEEGVASKEWSTMTEAAKRQGWGTRHLQNATALAKLPPVITGLFDPDQFSSRNAETLLALIRSVGLSKITRHAKLLSEQPGRRSTTKILEYLAGGSDDADCKLSVRRTSKDLTFSFTFDATHTRRKLIDVEQLRALAASALANSVEITD
ncbi:hypothetical protein [Caballeronia cordobensis]|uniref:hypothetical protein n=1 Tax=Caballeronia cordobensis TaxID=1353886 RepID=UPI00045EE805|nr:uncharacterized protein BRPE67_FCDS00070 [Burkholderia sp. RPE67]